jgi:ubiquinone/menaquinone biosynthesis C-methylase UbiE
LSTQQAKRFYDWFGAAQSSQAFYEDSAVSALIERGAFDRAEHVFEFGCGTGRVAERLFREGLSGSCRYQAVDVSSTMVALSRSRLAPWHDRVDVVLSDGSRALPARDAVVDRFVSTFVFDLLNDEAMDGVLTEAHRVLRPGGLLCLANSTSGTGVVGAAVSTALLCVNRLSPALLGGCRPIAVAPRLQSPRWRIVHRDLVRSWGVTSEVVVAERAA